MSWFYVIGSSIIYNHLYKYSDFPSVIPAKAGIQLWMALESLA